MNFSVHTYIYFITVQGLKYAPVSVASIIGCRLREPDWVSAVTFGGAPNFDVADSLDGAYLGPFM